jgi:hypothetical protein
MSEYKKENLEILKGLNTKKRDDAFYPIDINLKDKIHKDEFEFNRFWSSPEELPVKNIISVVLANPTMNDVKLVCKRYGIYVVRSIFNIMVKRNELSSGEKKCSDGFIKLLEKGT